jgi:hypothetical protein
MIVLLLKLGFGVIETGAKGTRVGRFTDEDAQQPEDQEST